MPRFSQTSIDRLRTCHHDLQVLFEFVIMHYDCTIVCGHRGKAEQDAAYNSIPKKSQLKWPNSKHNSLPSNAVDAAPYETGGIDWGKTQSAYFAGYVMGIAKELKRQGLIAHEIRCGIDWDRDNDVDDTKFWDACHFEIVPNI